MHIGRHSQQQIDQCLRQILPSKGTKRLLKFLPLAILGVILSGSCHLNRIAVALPFAGRPKRVLQRLRRWITRESFIVTQILPTVARGFIASCRGNLVLLLVDRTEWKHANLLVAAVSFRGRAIPVAISDLGKPKATKWSELEQLLTQAAEAIPPDAEVVVVGDREFGNIPAIKVIRDKGWHFCLDFKRNTWFEGADGTRWQAWDAFPAIGGRALWPDVLVTQDWYGPLNCMVIWDKGEDEPWVLVSDLPVTQLRSIYNKRMRIEELFSDLKSRGFDLEATRLRDTKRILRLAALLCIAYIWMLIMADYTIRRGWRRLVDAAKRRAISYYQIAARMIRYQPPEYVQPLFRAAYRAIVKK